MQLTPLRINLSPQSITKDKKVKVKWASPIVDEIDSTKIKGILAGRVSIHFFKCIYKLRDGISKQGK